MDRYYRDHPAWFVPAPGVDARVNGSGATYGAWTSRPDPENCRRLRCGWDWCYAPFIRTGDLYVHDDLAQYQPARPFSADRRVSAAEYRRNRARQFLNGRRTDVAMLCYTPSGVWCEERLARERYPAALTTDPQTKNYFDTPWCTGHDNELRVFPGAEPYASVLREDMERVWAENEIGGWAFDTAEGGARWQNAAAAGYPHGRAWDEDGVYVDEGVGIAELMDFGHQLRKGDRIAAVASNPTSFPSYLTPFRSDVLMVEGTPWGRHGGRPPEDLRWFAGHKTIVWWEDWLLEDLIDWQAMTPDEMRRAYRGVGDYAILESLRLGILPTPRMALGSPKVVQWTQVLADLVQRGWEPVPAVAGLPDLDRSRYGRELTSATGLGNKTAATVAGEVAVENAYLSDARDLLFTPRDGAELQQTVGERATRFAVSLPSREAAVYEARLGVASGGRGAATVSADSTHVTARLRGWRGLTALAAAPRPDLEVVSIAVNGQVTAVREPAPVTVGLTGDDTVVVTYRSLTFDDTRPAAERFPLTSAAVVAADPALLPAGQMVCDFIGRAVVAGGGQDPQAAPVESATGRRVVLGVYPSLPRPRRVHAEGDVLEVAGRTPEELWQAVRFWLAAVEDRYPYAGVFYRSPAADRAGLTGKALEP
ncbi:MAG: hypothetical protein HYU66_07695 [Armatimonadetes bacterium]|nr:hypothetical protein [Armatimonadota bacterium]